MPTYEYVCDSCKHAFDHFQSISSEVLVDCPACQQPSLRRLIGKGSGVIFKGSGFYQTDYKSKRLAKEEGKASKPPEES